ncbi:MAG: response regulator transcription factor [Oscillospiraceae bacterium]|nr:response regulator transcription factor [Oscillospiraceae bacterium]MDD4368441.1 response regulator transcription factor [Oscillospiraceae bacterium]
MRVLIVEDDKKIAEAIQALLEAQHYSVDLAHDGLSGLDDALSGIYDALILDVMLPGLNGFDLVRRMRREKIATPVLMLTARTSTDAKVEGLDAGADYYLTKPFIPAELLAAVRAVTRRQGEVLDTELKYGNLVLDRSTYTISHGQESLRLGNKEFQIIQLLLANPGRIVPKEDIILKVWGMDSDAEDNNVEVYISFLRRKLNYLHCNVEIQSARKVGYFLKLTDCGNQGDAL